MAAEAEAAREARAKVKRFQLINFVQLQTLIHLKSLLIDRLLPLKVNKKHPEH